MTRDGAVGDALTASGRLGHDDVQTILHEHGLMPAPETAEVTA